MFRRREEGGSRYTERPDQGLLGAAEASTLPCTETHTTHAMNVRDNCVACAAHAGTCVFHNSQSAPKTQNPKP